MGVIAVYENNVLSTRNKVGKMPQDDKGYREICVGAFDCMNLKGEYYDMANSIKAMFETGGRIAEMCRTGRMRGEIEHPLPQPGENLAMFIQRLKIIHNAFTAHTFRHLRLEPCRDHFGNSLVKCIGWIKGSGPYANVIEERMKNPDENVDLSIRSLTAPPRLVNGVPHKMVKTILTWDQTNQGGIGEANKYDSPSFEGINNEFFFTDDEPVIEITDEAMLKYEQDRLLMEQNISVESDELIPHTLLKTSLGWEKVQLVDPRSATFWK